MSNEKVVKESKVWITASLVAVVVIWVLWIVVISLDMYPLNNKLPIALSLLPLSLAFAYFLKLMRIRKSPKLMLNEIDERLVAQKNEADAKAFKVLQGLLFLTYMSYTLMVPTDIFNSIGWWALMGLLLVSLFSQGIFRQTVCKSDNSEV